MGNQKKEVIVCKQVTKTYRRLWAKQSEEVVALRDISLSISPGKIIGLVGPNGAGKSTLISLIAGLILPTQGKVTLNGYPARSIDARRNIGYMPESPIFLGLYSARKVLRYHGALFGLSYKIINDYSEELLNDLELMEVADRPCYGFSMGMKQRLALGVALIGNPPVLLLDEPSNGLDPIGIIKLRKLLKKISTSGKTILISSHRLDELAKLTSHYIFLHQGELVPMNEYIPTQQKELLRITMLPWKGNIGQEILSNFKVYEIFDTEIILGIDNLYDIPKVITSLVNEGARITGVTMENENIEDAFIRLCNERK